MDSHRRIRSDDILPPRMESPGETLDGFRSRDLEGLKPTDDLLGRLDLSEVDLEFLLLLVQVSSHLGSLLPRFGDLLNELETRLVAERGFEAAEGILGVYR